MSNVYPAPGNVDPSTGGGGGTPTPTPADSWITLLLSDATHADPLSVINTFNTSTGAVATNPTAGTFEGSGAQPPTWEWDIATDYSLTFANTVQVLVWMTGQDFERTSDTGWGVFLTDAASMSSNNGIGVAHVANGIGDRVSAGGQGGTMGQQNPGITGVTLRGRFDVALSSSDANTTDDPSAWLLDSDGKSGNNSHAVNSLGKTPTTMKLVLAYEQDATARAATTPLVDGVPAIRFRVIPVPS